MPRIFISYRRNDSPAQAGRLYDELRGHFGRHSVYRDIDSMKPGIDFVDRIERELRSAAAVVAVIGGSWVDATDSKGRRRLELADDYVRFELAAALKAAKPVIPVLVDGAEMPHRDALPADLAPLASQNALELVDRYWKWGIRELIEALEQIVGVPEQGPKSAERGRNADATAADELEAERKRFQTVNAVAQFLGERHIDVEQFSDHVARLLEVRNDEPLLEALVAAKPDMKDLSGRGPFQLGESVTPGLLVATPTRLLYIVQAWKLKTFEYPYERLVRVGIEQGRWRDDLLIPRWYEVLVMRLVLYSGESTAFRVRADSWRERALSLLDVMHSRTENGIVHLEVSARP